MRKIKIFAIANDDTDLTVVTRGSEAVRILQDTAQRERQGTTTAHAIELRLNSELLVMSTPSLHYIGSVVDGDLALSGVGKEYLPKCQHEWVKAPNTGEHVCKKCFHIN